MRARSFACVHVEWQADDDPGHAAFGAQGFQHRAVRAELAAHVREMQLDGVIRAELDDEKRTITAEATVTYHNASPDTLDYLWVQLDQNYFSKRADSRTAPNTKRGVDLKKFSYTALDRLLAYESYDGELKITRLTDAEGRGLPQDFEGDVTTHRQRGEGEARGRLGEGAFRHRADAVVPAEIGDLGVGEIAERVDLRLPVLPGRAQPVQQQDRLAAAQAGGGEVGIGQHDGVVMAHFGQHLRVNLAEGGHHVRRSLRCSRRCRAGCAGRDGHEVPAPRAAAEVDAAALRTDWAALQDTHHFFAMLKRHALTRTHALRLAGRESGRSGLKLSGPGVASRPVLAFAIARSSGRGTGSEVDLDPEHRHPRLARAGAGGGGPYPRARARDRDRASPRFLIT